MGAIVLLCVVLTSAHWILRILFTGDEEMELLADEDGNDVALYGRIILSLMGIITFITIMVVDGVEGVIMKWFWIVFIAMALGFQAFIDWKYWKGSKRYIVSLCVLVIGVLLGNFLL